MTLHCDDDAMTDHDELAHLVARDLKRHFADRVSDIDGPVYAVAIWADDGAGAAEGRGTLGVSVATEPDYQREVALPRNSSVPADLLSGPTGWRWNSGNWRVCAESFTTAETEAALEAISAWADEDGEADLDEEQMAESIETWLAVAGATIRYADPLALLDCSPAAIAFAEGPYVEGAPVEQAEIMLRTVPSATFHQAIPHWRRLSTLLRSPGNGTRSGSDELAVLLQACGLTMQDVASSSERLRRALSVGAA